MRKYNFVAMTALWLLPISVSPAMAQTAAPAGAAAALSAPRDSSEIIVTGARAREEVVQDVPLAVAILGSQQLEDSHVKTLNDLSSMTPNLTVTTMGVIAGTAAVSIRGFSAAQSDSAAEPGVAIYIDGVYQVQNFGSLSDLYDIERIEVLNGPQSAVLGRSASAGAILINHTRPTGEFGGKAEIEYGNYNQLRLNALLNFPIIEGKLAAKIFGGFERRDGYMKNLTVPGTAQNSVKRGTVRGALLFTPSDAVELYVTGDRQWDRSGQTGGRNITTSTEVLCQDFGICNPFPGRYKVTGAEYLRKPRFDRHSVAAHATFRPGVVDITSITGYGKLKAESQSDLDAVNGEFFIVNQTYDIENVSQEIRLTPEAGGGLDLDGRLAWILGGYWGHSRAENNKADVNFFVPRDQSGLTVRDGYAVFGQFDFDIIDRLTLSFGVRRSHDKTRHDWNSIATLPATTPIYPVPVRPRDQTQKASFNNTSFEGGLRYKLDDSKMVYFRYAEGYRGGGFNGLPGNAAATIGYGPESTKGYELGAKTAWFDNKLILNVTLFNVDFSDLQRVISVAFPTGGSGSVTSNAASARTRGIELQAVVQPVPELQLRANFGYLDAKYLKYNSLNVATGEIIDLSGLPLTFSPKYTASGDVAYEMDLGNNDVFDTATIRAAISWRDEFEMSNVLNPVGHQDSYATTDLSLEFARRDDVGYSLNLYVKNLFDTRYMDWAVAAGNILRTKMDNIGRTYGVTAGVKF